MQNGVPRLPTIIVVTLFLIYIKDLLGSWDFSSARMFADDTTLTASGESVLDAEVATNHDLATIEQRLSANKSSLILGK